MQKVTVGDKSIKIDYSQAKEILRDYGIPRNGEGVIPGSRISLYRISIFLRPVVERITAELDRSLGYFKKQNTNLEWEEFLFDGIGATFPHLLETFRENLNINVGLFNPLRNANRSYRNGTVIPDNMLPNYTINLALDLKESERVNVLPKNIRSGYKYIFLHKLVVGLVVLFFPLFIATTFLSNTKVDRMKQDIFEERNQWNQVSAKAKEYFDLLNDTEILNGFQKFLSNDRAFSKNQITILKLLSSAVTKNIKFTSLGFRKEVTRNTEDSADRLEEYKDVLGINGFVHADASMADILLTNFVIQLEELAVFSKVDMRIDEHSVPEDGKLFFTLNMWL